jgi:hypothetical protein
VIFQTFADVKLKFIVLIILSNFFYSSAQLTQTIRGEIIDKVSSVPLPGAAIFLNDSTLLSTASNDEGEFRLEHVPLGRKIITVSYLGYKHVSITLVVTSGKEVVVEIELEQSVIQQKEITITAERQKDRANNELAYVSSRSFTVEETSRYAGGLNDPSRMAANYAGVSGANDARNDIVIRGNSPLGLLWRFNGIEIPNPNHFGSLGSTGGPISMLNNNQLDKSDFLTGAFPAEYGNATAGVFDLQMRPGNNEKNEFLAQAGFNGFEFGAEGPFSKNNSSYLINYRYSTLGIFKAIGINFGAGTAVPEYQDISFRTDFKIPSGKLVFFGIGGKSYVEVLDRDRDTTEKDLYLDSKRQDGYFGNTMGVIGIQHLHFFSSNAYSKLTVSAGTAGQDYKVDSISISDNTPVPLYRDGSSQEKYSLTWILNEKFSSANSLKSGFIIDRFHYTYRDSSYEQNSYWQVYSDFDGVSYLLQAFTQWQHKFSDQLSFTSGIHFQNFFLNNTYAIEARAAMRYEIKSGEAFSIGVGMHSQLQPMYAYFQKTYLSAGSYIESNHNLGFTKSNQLVMAYDKAVKKDLRFKIEMYYQDLYNVPVENRSSWYSILNEGADFGIGNVDSLINNGNGKNYGAEFTIEKFYSRGYYYLLTASLYNSLYSGSDKIERNTAFNGNFIMNVLGGKELTVKNKNVFAFNIKSTYAGGKRFIPVDFNASVSAGETKFDYSQAYEKRRKNYFRTDIRFAYRINRKKSTHEISLDIDNVFNTQNIWNEQFDPRSGTVKTQYQLGIFPIPQYRLTF